VLTLILATQGTSRDTHYLFHNFNSVQLWPLYFILKTLLAHDVMNLVCILIQAAGEAQTSSKKSSSSSSELNLNLDLEDPDDDTDADLMTEEQRDIDSNPRPESRLKRKGF
jgi:hypothetical protein